MSAALLDEVARWSLDAKLEDAKRYFYPTRMLTELYSGSKSYVVGRKGTGKTAISEHLHSQERYDHFSQRLTFKNYPMNELYELGNDRYLAPNQYITLWKYVIYSAVLKLMAGNQAIERSVRAVLSEMFPDDPVKNLARRVRTWRTVTAKLNILGAEATLEGKQELTDSDVTWVDRIDDMERVISKYIDRSVYNVTVDELDDGFVSVEGMTPDSRYSQLLTGLFKAVQDVKAAFPPKRHARINPIVFLRDDVYESIVDDDKAKWTDLLWELRWDSTQLRNLMTHRILRAKREAGSNFNHAWSLLFRPPHPNFETLASWTFFRPRDLIAFSRIAARKALHGHRERISQGDFGESRLDYSTHTLSEIADEIRGTLPEIKAIFDLVLPTFGGATFSAADMRAQLAAAVRDGLRCSISADRLLRVLFAFSVIGHPGHGQSPSSFRFMDPRAPFRLDRAFTIHKALRPALRVLDLDA